MNKTELKREIKELELDVSIAQGRRYAARRMLELYEYNARMAKQAKCNHKFSTKWERLFEGEGFRDIEYQYCARCGKVEDQREVQVVLKSEK